MIRAMREKDVDNLSALLQAMRMSIAISSLFLFIRRAVEICWRQFATFPGEILKKRNSLSQESIFKMTRKSWLALRKSLM